MALTIGNITTTDYGGTITEPAAANGDLLIAEVTWFYDVSSTASISGWNLLAKADSGTPSGNQVCKAVFWKIKGTGYSGPHSVSITGGGGDHIAVTVAWSGQREGNPFANDISTGGNNSDPLQITLSSLTVPEDGCQEVITIGTWFNTATQPAGYTLITYHSFEHSSFRLAVDAGTAPQITVGRAQGDYGAAVRYIIRPASDDPDPFTGEIEETSPAREDNISANILVAGSINELSTIREDNIVGDFVANAFEAIINEQSTTREDNISTSILITCSVDEESTIRQDNIVLNNIFSATINEQSPIREDNISGSFIFSILIDELSTIRENNINASVIFSAQSNQESSFRQNNIESSFIFSSQINEQSSIRSDNIIANFLTSSFQGIINEFSSYREDSILSTSIINGIITQQSHSRFDNISSNIIYKSLINEVSIVREDSISAEFVEIEAFSGSINEFSPAREDLLLGSVEFNCIINEISPSRIDVILGGRAELFLGYNIKVNMDISFYSGETYQAAIPNDFPHPLLSSELVNVVFKLGTKGKVYYTFVQKNNVPFDKNSILLTLSSDDTATVSPGVYSYEIVGEFIDESIRLLSRGNCIVSKFLPDII